jgi:hypothetical protein
MAAQGPNNREMTMAGRAVLSLRRDKPAQAEWLCKPCGARLTPDPALAPEEPVRCPACNAKLGKAADFANPQPGFPRLRARPAPPLKTAAPAVLTPRSAKTRVWVR